MNEEYLTAVAIVFTVMAVCTVGGYILFSKGFTRQRQTLPTIVGINSGLFVLLSKYREWRIEAIADEKTIQRCCLYFDHGMNPSFCPTIKANAMGMKVLKSHKRRTRKS